MSRGRLLFLAAVVAPGWLSACSGPAVAPSVTVSQVVAVGAAGAQAFSVYGTIESTGGDTLVALHSESGRGSLHQMEMSEGMMRMRPVARIPLEAGTFRLESGRMHGMLEDLSVDLSPGDSVTLEFRFARAQPVAVRAPVLTPASYVER